MPSPLAEGRELKYIGYIGYDCGNLSSPLAEGRELK